jgi:hypothetical protein
MHGLGLRSTVHAWGEDEDDDEYQDEYRHERECGIFALPVACYKVVT